MRSPRHSRAEVRFQAWRSPGRRGDEGAARQPGTDNASSVRACAARRSPPSTRSCSMRWRARHDRAGDSRLGEQVLDRAADPSIGWCSDWRAVPMEPHLVLCVPGRLDPRSQVVERTAQQDHVRFPRGAFQSRERRPSPGVQNSRTRDAASAISRSNRSKAGPLPFCSARALPVGAKVENAGTRRPAVGSKPISRPGRSVPSPALDVLVGILNLNAGFVPRAPPLACCSAQLSAGPRRSRKCRETPCSSHRAGGPSPSHRSAHGRIVGDGAAVAVRASETTQAECNQGPTATAAATGAP